MVDKLPRSRFLAIDNNVRLVHSQYCPLEGDSASNHSHAVMPRHVTSQPKHPFVRDEDMLIVDPTNVNAHAPHIKWADNLA